LIKFFVFLVLFYCFWFSFDLDLVGFLNVVWLLLLG